MSSKKDERKNDDKVETKLEQQASFTSQQLLQQEVIRKAMIDAFEEARNNTRRALEEATKEIPRYTEAINSYQEQIFHDTKEIADIYIDSQTEFIKSLRQPEWISHIGDVYPTFWSNLMLSPNRQMMEAHANAVSRTTDNTFNATVLTNNIILANMEAFKIAVQRTKESAKEISSLATNSTKLVEMAKEMYLKQLNQLLGQSTDSRTER
jgi:hypothetical protein